MITVFAPQTPGKPGIRIWNPQLIRYAGYRQPDGKILGDPAHIHLTEYVRRLGWRVEERTAFDVLPLVIEMPGQHPQIFDLPRDAVLEVPIRHPTYSWFQGLGLKWHALPVISNMRLELGGISYTAAPFNGWYMGTEIGARNFGDWQRYDLLPLIAENLGLPLRSKETLWKDRALVELNVAVLHSFRLAGVRIVDHHTAARQFLQFEEHEREARRKVFGEWAWLVPPLSGSAVEIFHRPYENRVISPNFFEQPVPWHLADIQDEGEQADGPTGERLAHPLPPPGSAAKCPFSPPADTDSAA
jgi:nitric-oxide synthase